MAAEEKYISVLNNLLFVLLPMSTVLFVIASSFPLPLSLVSSLTVSSGCAFFLCGIETLQPAGYINELTLNICIT